MVSNVGSPGVKEMELTDNAMNMMGCAIEDIEILPRDPARRFFISESLSSQPDLSK
ncbi:hypothetical protein PV325_006036, partial [Microctonus aethiopoides]